MEYSLSNPKLDYKDFNNQENEEYKAKDHLLNKIKTTDFNKNENGNNQRPNFMTVSESIWLQDIMYAIQGIDGRYLKYSEANKSFNVIGAPKIPKSVLDVVLKLSKLGVLYKRVIHFIKISSSQTDSIIIQSLTSKIQKELIEYYKFTAAIQTHLKKYNENQNKSLLRNQYQNINNQDQNNEQNSTLTLRKLLILSEAPMNKLQVLSTIIDIVESSYSINSISSTNNSNNRHQNDDSFNNNKSNLISELHSCSNHGNPIIQTFMSELLREVTIPFYSSLKAWIYEGKLVDPYNEFFIIQDKTNDNKNVWRKHYFFRLNSIPNFMEKETARKAFIIGKSLKFLMNCCGEEEYLLSRGNLANEAIGFEYGKTEILQRTIDSLYEEINHKVISVLINKFKLFVHISALKRILLLEQGDLAYYLVEEINDMLSKPAKNIYLHNISVSLEAAIRSSNLQYEDPNVLARLDVRLIKKRNQEKLIGWDVFSLDYAIDTPIDTVLNNDIMETYYKLSSFLWKIRRVEHIVTSTWKRRNIIATRFHKQENPHHTAIHSSLIILKTMQDFISRLEFYLFYEVLETSFNKFKDFVNNKNGDLDMLILEHKTYILNVMNKFFLTNEDEYLFNKLSNILSDIINFTEIFCKFCDVCILKLSDKNIIDFIINDSEIIIEDTFTLSTIDSSTSIKSYGYSNNKSPIELLVRSWNFNNLCNPIQNIITKFKDENNNEFYNYELKENEIINDSKNNSIKCITCLINNIYVFENILIEEGTKFNNDLIDFLDHPKIKDTSLYFL